MRPLLVYLLLFCCARAQAGRTLDSLRQEYTRADLYKRINTLYGLGKNGEKKEKLDALLESVRQEVNAINVDSVTYHFMFIEGDIMVYSGNNGEGLKKLIEALKYYERTNDRNRGSTLAYKIGRYYFYTNDMQKALKYIRLSDKLSDEKSIQRKATNKMVIGVIYQNLKIYDSSLYYQEQALAIKEKHRMWADIPVSLNNIADVYSEMNEQEKAMFTIERSIKLSDSLHIEDALAYAQHVKGVIYNRTGKYNDALYWLLPASRFWENRKSYDDLLVSYEHLAKAYEGTGNYKRAYECQQLLGAVKDTLFNATKLKNASDLEAKYQNEKNALEIAAQKAENKVVEAQKKNQLTIFLLVAAFLVIMAIVIYTRYKKQKKDKELIALQKAQLEVRNKDIEDSISYSSRVQQSIFPSLEQFRASFTDSFILFRPKEKVSGDFYWHERRKNLVLFAAADCTGHGVPGAMVSVVCSTALNRVVKEFGITSPGEVLDKTRELVVDAFAKNEAGMKDGMDISFCVLDTEKNELHWAGANNPLWVIKKGDDKITVVEPDKQPIGIHSKALPFTTHKLNLHAGDCIYVFTDGYADQFGGEKGKKFKAAKMNTLLLSVKNLDLEKQKQALNNAFDEWRGDLEQIDDVCVIGVKL